MSALAAPSSAALAHHSSSLLSGGVVAPAWRSVQMLINGLLTMFPSSVGGSTSLLGCSGAGSAPTGLVAVVPSTPMSQLLRLSSDNIVAVTTCVIVLVLMLLRLTRSRGGFSGGSRRSNEGARPQEKETGGGGGGDEAAPRPQGAAVAFNSFLGLIGSILNKLGSKRDVPNNQEEDADSDSSQETIRSQKKKRKLNRKTRLLAEVNLQNNRFYLGNSSNHQNGNIGSFSTEYKSKKESKGVTTTSAAASSTSTTPPPVTASSLAAHQFEEFKATHLLPQGKTPNPDLPTLIFTMGIPGCGKSTWARNYIDTKVADPATFAIVSTDEIRKELLGDVNDQTRNKLVFEIALCQCQSLLRNGRSVIFDGTNVQTPSRRAFLRRLLTGEEPNISLVGGGGGSSYGGGNGRVAHQRANPSSSSHTRHQTASLDNTSSRSLSSSMGSSSAVSATPPTLQPISSSPLPRQGGGGAASSAIHSNKSDSLGAIQVVSGSESFRGSPIQITGVSTFPSSPVETIHGGGGKYTKTSASVKGRSHMEVMSRAEAMVRDAMVVMDGRCLNSSAVGDALLLQRAAGEEAATSTSSSQPIQCNRLLKVFNVTKAVAKGRISRDIQKKVDRSDVPPHVVDSMSVHLQESLSTIKDENWIPLVA